MSENGLFDAARGDLRPHCQVVIFTGLVWPVLEDYAEVTERLADAEVDDQVVLLIYDGPDRTPARLAVSRAAVIAVTEITDERWKADEAQREAQVEAMREQERQVRQSIISEGRAG